MAPPLEGPPPTPVPEEGTTELERTIGLLPASAIGIGTMVGAGIFVFPGLAAGRAGPAAAVSFTIGAVIAMLVALPTSEMATAMPRSGGGYFFVSRGFGGLMGSVVGLSLWCGLVFASGFYLVGFGHYAAAVLLELGISLTSVVTPLALVAGLTLTVVSILGTERATQLQNGIVGILLVILGIFLSYGGLSAVGLIGAPSPPETFAPFGRMPILTTAALVFTSYLGFAQVATVAGEIQEPDRNLPRAMVGSVLVVGVLYVATIFVSTSAIGSERLATFGETAIVEVARSLAGPLGAVAILVAGLLATLSSANASLLSSSRTVYALARDAVLPKAAGRVNLRYGTPHVSLVLAGVPTLVLVLAGEVEMLAEVASFLHLVMYGLICFALIAFRRAGYDWYDPDFRSPGYPWLPLVGGVACFGLIAFMQPASQILGVVVLALAGLWHLVYARDVDWKGVTG